MNNNIWSLHQKRVEVLGTAQSYGAGTMFMAKIQAIKFGLQHGWDLGHWKIICYTDCAHAVAELQSETSVDQFWARELIMRVRRMMRWDWHVSMVQLPRERNTSADMLARKAVRDGGPCHVWNQLPSSLIPFIAWCSNVVCLFLFFPLNQKKLANNNF